MSVRHQLLSLFVILLCANCATFAGQELHTYLTGNVVDANHALIPGAKITLTSPKQHTVYAETTGENGAFSIDLPPGDYLLKVAADGFAETTMPVHHTTTSNHLEILIYPEATSALVTVRDSGGYQVGAISSATKTLTELRDIPQSIAVVTSDEIHDRTVDSVAAAVAYVPGITSHQGENNRDQLVLRGNSTSADFFVNGVRDDVQYYRDFYNIERLEALKGPNAMIFGRGGGGGVVNRVTKEAMFASSREFILQGGSFHDRRLTTDLNQRLSNKVAVRLNALYERSGSFRDFVRLNRYGLTPTATFALNQNTSAKISFEHFHDARIADRGLPSFAGLPADVPISTYFGNPDDSRVNADVNLWSAAFDHQAGRLSIRNRTIFGNYDRFYQNYVPGVVSADYSKVSLSAYNNSSRRQNIFNQTDLTYSITTGNVKHNWLGGVELGQQLTDNFRNTGFFSDTLTSIQVPLTRTVIASPVTFRQSPTDANNHVQVGLSAFYVQDQIEFSRRIQVIAGVRSDYFDLKYHNNRTREDRRRIDRLISPRVGVVAKPAESLSVYGNYSVSYLPSSGDQFSSLTNVTQQLEPEKFENYELGAKWDVRRNLSLTTAIYRLDRTNTRATDPNDPTKIIQTGSQRTNGIEVGINGNISDDWRVSGGYAYQDAFISNATTSAPLGARASHVPRHTFSLWNHYQIVRRLAAGLGMIHRANMFAAIDDKVTLPGYTRFDAAMYYSFSEKWRFQVNIENLFDRRYYANADNNNNISPGRPRGAHLSLVARF